MNAMTSISISQLASEAQNQALLSPTDFTLPAVTIRQLQDYGISKHLIDTLFGPSSTIVSLVGNEENLDAEKTDRAVRVLRIVGLAEKVFEDPEKAKLWLDRYNNQLKAKPFDLLVRESGATIVEQALLRMEYGVIA